MIELYDIIEDRIGDEVGALEHSSENSEKDSEKHKKMIEDHLSRINLYEKILELIREGGFLDKNKKYAVKNKEGKYLGISQNFETCDLVKAKLFDTPKRAFRACPEECEIVKITIAEGDLKQEIENLKDDLSRKESLIKKWQKQLAEKDKMVDIACGKLVDFEYENKESVHSAQFWKERLESLAKQELEKEIEE